MAAPGSLVVWRAVFAALGTFMVGTLVYTCATDGSPFRPELLTPWLVATLVDFYVNVIAISAWVIYKETNWISSAIWVVLLFCFGSAATCAYIVKKLFEVTPTGPSQDPLDLLLLRQGNPSQRNCSCVTAERIIFSILGIFMAAVVTYTVITDGLPFRAELLTPSWKNAVAMQWSCFFCGRGREARGCFLVAFLLVLCYHLSTRNFKLTNSVTFRWMAATLIDFYINIFAISVWVAHKESSWISTAIWICLLICFGSMTTCGYIVIQLFQVSYQDPIYHVLLNCHSKYGTVTSP